MHSLRQRDGHIHTPFCPHGSQDPLDAYILKACELGRTEITFTEHFPLPQGVTTEAFAKECALEEREVLNYLAAVKAAKVRYEHQIKINVGFEVDYVEGFESEIRSKLADYSKSIDDSLLSVHFVQYNGQYYAVDYLEDFKRLLEQTGSLEVIYDLYFETLLKSIEADLGEDKPRRIGHPSLVRLFNKKYPLDYDDKGKYEQIAKALKSKGYAFDLNVAGIRRPYCGETYPDGILLDTLKQYQVPYVYGSDAHEANQQIGIENIEMPD